MSTYCARHHNACRHALPWKHELILLNKMSRCLLALVRDLKNCERLVNNYQGLATCLVLQSLMKFSYTIKRTVNLLC
jgi:hypothetical protein